MLKESQAVVQTGRDLAYEKTQAQWLHSKTGFHHNKH